MLYQPLANEMDIIILLETFLCKIVKIHVEA